MKIFLKQRKKIMNLKEELRLCRRELKELRKAYMDLVSRYTLIDARITSLENEVGENGKENIL